MMMKAMTVVYLWVLLLVILVLLGVYGYLMTIGDTPASTPLSLFPLQHPRNSCHCHFLSTRDGRIVALASLPGSGNTWVRGLLEMATRVCTGSTNCDKFLKVGGFCGEGVMSGRVLVVKTHVSSLRWKGEYYKTVAANHPLFDAAIFLIRSPFGAAVADYNRIMSLNFSRHQTGSRHVKYLGNPQFFGQNPLWNQTLQRLANKWKLMIYNNLLSQRRHPVLTITYEDLKTNTVAEMLRMLNFLQFPYLREEVEQRLQGGFTKFYRNHTDSFDHFTSEQKVFVNGIISDVVQKLRNNKHTALAIKLQEYML